MMFLKHIETGKATLCLVLGSSTRQLQVLHHDGEIHEIHKSTANLERTVTDLSQGIIHAQSLRLDDAVAGVNNRQFT